MKLLSIVSSIALLLFAAGCADPLEQTSTDEVGNQLQRGLTGHGQLGPIDRPAGDPAAENAGPQAHP